MKKIISILLIAVMMLGLTACSPKEPEPEPPWGRNWIDGQNLIESYNNINDSLCLYNDGKELNSHWWDSYFSLIDEEKLSGILFFKASPEDVYDPYGFASTFRFLYNESPDVLFGMNYMLDKLENSADSATLITINNLGENYIKNLLNGALHNNIYIKTWAERFLDTDDDVIEFVIAELNAYPNGRAEIRNIKYTGASRPQQTQQTINEQESPASTTAETADYPFEIKNVVFSHNTIGYAVVEGNVYNSGDTSYTFVQVRIAWKDSSGNTINTDSTYAVGNEGIFPGESSTFRSSVKDENNKIVSADVTILSYK
ncbi:MAG: FxLYD domain-containing protein [Oscillospiraceae bacterium]|nr:FxLYD domain-containing protein [Oscillospiraceae bacterium]